MRFVEGLDQKVAAAVVAFKRHSRCFERAVLHVDGLLKAPIQEDVQVCDVLQVLRQLLQVVRIFGKHSQR